MSDKHKFYGDKADAFEEGVEYGFRQGRAAGWRDAIEAAAKACESFGRAHTYASENADHYRGFDSGTVACANRIRALPLPHGNTQEAT